MGEVDGDVGGYGVGIWGVDEQSFKQRTKNSALRVIQLVESLPVKTSTTVIGKQLIRCATSVGANYRPACRTKPMALWTMTRLRHGRIAARIIRQRDKKGETCAGAVVARDNTVS